MTKFLSICVAAVVTVGLTAGANAETYRLVHAIGNTEHEAARDLSKAECETKKAELKAAAEALGTYNERTGYGSITCLPESLFED